MKAKRFSKENYSRIMSAVPSAKSELLLFQPKPYQVSMVRGGWVDYYPLSTITNDGKIDFEINTGDDEYLDLNDTALYVKFSIENGQDAFKATDSVAPVNLILSSMFRDITLSLNHTQIETMDNNYPYKAMMTTLLQYTADVASSQFAAAGWYPDTAGKMDTLTGANHGFKTRSELCQGSKVQEVMGPLFCDFFTQSRYLLPKTTLQVQLYQANSEFSLLSTVENANPKIKIHDAVLYVRRVAVHPSVKIGHEKGLLKSNAIYPLQSSRVLSLSIPQGATSIIRDNILNGKVPKVVVIGFVKDEAYSGSLTKNPFNFHHFNLNSLALYVNGSATPMKELKPNFKNGLCVREYVSMFQNLEMFGKNETNSISLDEFKSGGYNLFVFNLTPDLDLNGGQVQQLGNLRIEAKFSKALMESINMIVYSISDGEIQITKDRSVIKL
jgi:hypothetical protein